MSSRTLRRGHARTTDDLRSLLQALFVAELLKPTQELWLISPWISDIAVIDNGDGGFGDLHSEWGARDIRLSENSAQLMSAGTHVYVEVRPDEHKTRFLQRLQSAGAASTALHVRIPEVLHEKGLLSDSFLLSGSMNFTYSGVRLLDELVRYDTGPSVIAEGAAGFSCSVERGGSVMDVALFLQRWFGDGNDSKLPPDWQARPGFAKLRAFLEDLEVASERPIFLPRINGSTRHVYAVALKAPQGRRLVESLAAFVGPSYSHFDSVPAVLRRGDPLEGALLDTRRAGGLASVGAGVDLAAGVGQVRACCGRPGSVGRGARATIRCRSGGCCGTFGWPGRR